MLTQKELGSGAILRLIRPLDDPITLRDTLDWIGCGGRVLVRGPGRLDFARRVVQRLDGTLSVFAGDHCLLLVPTAERGQSPRPRSSGESPAGYLSADGRDRAGTPHAGQSDRHVLRALLRARL